MRFLKDPAIRFQWLVTILVALIIGPIGLCLYWAADRQLPILAQSGVFVGWDKNNPRIGWIEWTGIRQRVCDGTSYRWLVDGIVVELPPIHVWSNGKVDNPDKKSSSWRVAFEVPEWFRHNGSYRARILYQCNPLQKVFPLIVQLPDIAFKMPDGEVEPLSHEIQNPTP